MVELENVFWQEDLNALVNHADFWALAASLGVEQGIKMSQSKCKTLDPLGYYWGRAECKAAPLSKAWNVFPDPSMSLDQMFNYYATQFGFTPREVTFKRVGKMSMDFE